MSSFLIKKHLSFSTLSGNWMKEKALLWKESFFFRILPGLQIGSSRVMVYHTRSNKADNASPLETGTDPVPGLSFLSLLRWTQPA